MFVVLIYAALQIVLFASHDPWLDEAQAWLWATSISRPIDFLIIPGEGHPPLWYWILRLLSVFLDFNQARILGLVTALANAALLWRLLGRDAPLLFAMLGSFVVLQFWGYQFRPYNIVFTCILGALLLDRQGKGVGATWLLALACGFHFFSGLLLAFWLVYQRTRGTAVLPLLPPSLLALAFGALALLSGLGNTTVGPATPDLLTGTLHNLSWVGMIEPLRGLWLALATIAVLIVGLYRQPVILMTVLALLLAFALGTAAIYGKYPWHSAFMTMLCFMAVMVTGLRGRRWVLLALLLPQVAFGVAGVVQRLATPAWNAPDLYAAISHDAGAGFDPARQLIAWPDLAGVSMAATKNITLVSGNDGSLLGPINWRNRTADAIDPALAERAGPYWLLCGETCGTILDYLGEHGRTTTLLARKTNIDNGEFLAYRVD
nr:hypothetical protein [uncultured Devosia sp.]